MKFKKEILAFIVIIILLLYGEYKILKIRKKKLSLNTTEYSIRTINISSSIIFSEEFTLIKTSFVNNFCKSIPTNLIGNITIKTNPPTSFKPFDFNLFNESTFNEIKNGGHWAPVKCKPRHRVAIILPYKNREQNLKIFLYNMHPFLQRQEINYKIFVVEQVNNELFNKGILMNAGFQVIHNQSIQTNLVDGFQFDCVIFHDVDLLPTDDLNLYTCPEKRPRHMSIIVGQLDYREGYPILVGGVLIFKKEHFLIVNGYSNMFWGWGAEDDNMYHRLVRSGIGFERPARNTIYQMLDHKQTERNKDRVKILYEGISMYKQEGLNSVVYKLAGVVKYPLFTHILIDVGKPVAKKT